MDLKRYMESVNKSGSAAGMSIDIVKVYLSASPWLF